MSPDQITAKRFSRRTAIPTGRLLSGQLSEEEWSKLAQVSDVLLRSGVHLNDRYDLSVAGIQSLAESVSDLQAVVVDYLGLIQPANRGGSTYENTTQISRDLKRLALSLNVPVICLCQLSRSVESREDKRPRLSDLRDSGAIEQDADAVVFLFRDDYYKGITGDSSTVALNIAKNRHGELGTITFQFFRAISGFKEVP
jgi:replicative DNA helicase